MNIELIEKLVSKFLKEEDLRQAAGYRGSSFQDIERQSQQQQHKVWTSKDSLIWFFQLNKQETQVPGRTNYQITLGKQLDWQSGVVNNIQNNTNEKERIPYNPNVFVRSEGLDIITGFVVAQNEQQAKKLLDDYVRERRKLDQQGA